MKIYKIIWRDCETGEVLHEVTVPADELIMLELDVVEDRICYEVVEVTEDENV